MDSAPEVDRARAAHEAQTRRARLGRQIKENIKVIAAAVVLLASAGIFVYTPDRLHR